jgi:hypothetical protein
MRAKARIVVSCTAALATNESGPPVIPSLITATIARFWRWLATLGMEIGTHTPAEFAVPVRESWQRYRDIVKASGFKAEP